MAWTHRITGIFMVLYACLHIYSLSFLTQPADYDTKMKRFGGSLFLFLSWLLSLPVILHALNGGRLILYEMFGSREDESMIRWVWGLSIVFVLVQGFLMSLQNQFVSPIFFWLAALIAGAGLSFRVLSKIRGRGSSTFWKFQRITGSFLLVMIPAHLLFMHLQPTISHEAAKVIFRMQHPFMKAVDLSLIFVVLYHAGYGLVSITKDYFESGILQNGLVAIIFLVIATFGWLGIQLTVGI